MSSSINKTKDFIKKHKRGLIIAGVAYFLLTPMLLPFALRTSDTRSENSNYNISSEENISQAEVRGVAINQACSILREKGWNIAAVSGKSSDRNTKKESDCNNDRDKVTDVQYAGKDATLYFTFEADKAPNDRQAKNTQTHIEGKETYMSALRKCTVMEAFDIHTTGIGKKTDNAFNDARRICNDMFANTYKSDESAFVKAVMIDWADRKSEKIDGHDMTYYLSILGW